MPSAAAIFDGVAARWLWRQTHREVASELLALAHRSGVREADVWATTVLANAQSHGAANAAQILRAAQLAALGRALPESGQPMVVSVADIRRLASQGSAGAPAGQAGQNWHDAQTARAAFNHPAHWRDAGGGRVAPDTAQLEGESAAAWRSLTDKFGDELARTLFDAKARGGDATAVIDAIEASGSDRTLTVVDLAHLQFVCLTNGQVSPGVSLPTLHDALHSYGTSMFEEMYGDAHTEGLVRSLFSLAASDKISIDASRPLSAQPAAVQALEARLRDDFASVTVANLAFETRAAFYQTDDIGYESFKDDWYADPSQNADKMARLLDANGALAHLDASTRARVDALIHDRADPGSFESISMDLTAAMAASRFGASMFPPRFTAWLARLAEVTREASERHSMSRARFDDHAAQAIAMALTLERAAPGSLRAGPSGTRLSDPAFPPELRALDLRQAYPAVLRGVRQALGLSR